MTKTTDALRSLMNARRRDEPSASPSPLNEDMQSLLSRLQSMQQRINRLEEDASSDDLTGLANKRTLEKELERSLATARRYGRRHALMLIEVDGFSGLADQLGEEVADGLQQHVARLLRQNIRPTDIAARTQPGQFAAVLNELRAIENAEMRAADLSRVIAQAPYIGHHRTVHLSANVGFYVFGADDELPEIFSRAEASRGLSTLRQPT